MDGFVKKGHGNFNPSEVAHAVRFCSGSGSRLSANLVMVGERPQLHAMGMGPLGNRFRGECAVRNNGVAVEVGVQYGGHHPILRLGLSNFSVEQIEKCQQVHPVASLQPQYNMLFRNIEKDQMPFCKKNNIGIVAYSPMARGLLTGKFSREHLNTLAPDDHRRKSDIFIEPAFSKNLEFVERIKPIAQRNGKTSAQLAIAWVLRRDEITSAIVGARKPGQIGETAKAGDWSLSRQDIAEIENIINEMQI